MSLSDEGNCDLRGSSLHQESTFRNSVSTGRCDYSLLETGVDCLRSCGAIGKASGIFSSVRNDLTLAKRKQVAIFDYTTSPPFSAQSSHHCSFSRQESKNLTVPSLKCEVRSLRSVELLSRRLALAFSDSVLHLKIVPEMRMTPLVPTRLS